MSDDSVGIVPIDPRPEGEPPRAELPPVLDTAFDLAAAAFLEALKLAIEQVPFFEESHPAKIRLVQQNKSFPDELITTMIAAVEGIDDLSALGKFPVNKARATVQFMVAFKAPIDAVFTLYKNMQFTYDYLKAVAVRDCRRMYAISKGLGLDPSDANEVATYLQFMKRDINRPGPRKKKAKAPSSGSGAAE